MTNPDCDGCPACTTPSYDLVLKERVRIDEFGEKKPSGLYWSCKCGAYTRSPSDGVVNLLGKVAKKHKIKKVDPNRVAQPVAPLVRRK